MCLIGFALPVAGELAVRARADMGSLAEAVQGALQQVRGFDFARGQMCFK